jgi:hypothetical protein
VRTRLGIAPNHVSFRAGVLRTHLVTALLACVAAEYRATTAAVFIRWDDTNQARTGTVEVDGLLREIRDVAGIPLTAIPPTLASGADTVGLRQTQRRERHEQALAQLRDQQVVVRRDDVWWLSIDALDHQLQKAGIDPRELIHDSVVNLRQVPASHPEAEVPLTRADGSPLWHLTTVVDDLDLGITLVVRGSDKINAVAVQERLRWALSGGRSRVAYVFVSRLLETDRDRPRVAALLHSGIRPSALRWFLAEPYLSPSLAAPPETFQDLVTGFRPTLPTVADRMLDEDRLRAFDRKISASLTTQTAATELRRRLRSDDVAALSEFVVTHWPRPLPDQLRLYDGLTAQEVPFDAPPAGAEEALAWVQAWLEDPAAIDTAPHAVRWVLTGCHHGPAPRHLLSLIPLELIRARVRQASGALHS